MSVISTKTRFLLWTLLILLQILPGCALISKPEFYPAGIRESATAQPTTNPATYGYTADYRSFARQSAESDFRNASADSPVSASVPLAAPTEISDVNVWPVSLLEAVQLALSRNEIIPVDVQFLARGNPLLNTPQQVASIYDPAIQASGVSGARGTLAATSDFVPVLTARSTYGQDSVIQNNLVSAGLPVGSVLNSNTGNMEVSLKQQLRGGGTLEFRNTRTFNENNVTSNLFPSVYQGQMAVEFNQPLWGGAGDFFTSVAGPIDLISTRAPSVDQGIAVTRINERLSHNDFQIALRQLVKDVADVYQDLSLAHERYEIESHTRDTTKTIWKRLQAKSDSGVGSGLAAEAQAEENYYAAEARVKDILSEISLIENRMRRLIGQEPGHGLVIRPISHSLVNIRPEDWEQSLQTAFAQRPELNETILTIQSLEMQRSASINLTQPRLDLVSNFHVNGFGDRMFNDSGQVTTRPDSYTQNLLRGEQTGWFAGLQLSVPLDRRLTRSLQRQLEFRLAKTRATLNAQKKELAYELWNAFRSAERWSEQVLEQQRRVAAAERQASALDAAFPTGRVSVDLLVRAQTTLAQAETDFARAKVEYNKAVFEIQYRRGTLLEDLHISVLNN